MKVADTIASVILACAVLLCAYAVGLLIRAVRTGGVPVRSQTVAEVNDASSQPQVAALAGGPVEETENAAEQVAEPTEQAPTTADPNSVPQKQKKPLKAGADGRRGGKGSRTLSPEERERMRQRLETASEEQRQSPKLRSQPKAGGGRQKRSSDVSEGDTDAGQDTETTGPEPGERDQG